MRRGREVDFSDNGFEAWGGYMNAKIAKLEEQFLDKCAQETNKTSNIFSGISIFVNGYTKPSADELKCLMSQHGGTYHHYFRNGKTNFIIASNLPDTKVKNLPTTKIVKPEWVSESIKAGFMLDYKEYLLHTNQSRTQPRLNFKNAQSTAVNSNSVIKESTLINREGKNKRELCSLTNHIENFIPNFFNNEDIKRDKLANSVLQNKPAYFNHDSADSTKERDGNPSTRTAVDPRFLSEFYSNSRLHHISQLGAAFKQHVNDLRSNHTYNFPMRDHLKQRSESIHSSMDDPNEEVSDDKVIMHIDMDCFFVSVGLRNHPELRGHPVAVTHAKNSGGNKRTTRREGVNRQAEFNMYKKKQKNRLAKNDPRTADDFDEKDEPEITSRVDGVADEDDMFGSMSEIASCSYEARALGLRNGMFMGPALRLCPNLKTIPYDFEGYKEVAYTLYNTVAQYTLDIEAVSCDEMYVDCTELLKDIGITSMEFADYLRKEIKNKTDCPCSTGFGENRLQARLATKKAKPDGQFHLPKDQVESYFNEVELSELPGVGRQMQYKLSSLGYTTCESIRSTVLSTLQKHFGNKTGQLLYHYSRGQDTRPLNFTAVRKSISAGVNYGIRFEDNLQCEIFLKQLCEEVCSRMTQNSVLGKTITLKLMVRAVDAPVETAKFMGHGVCDNITKTTNLPHMTNNLEVITKEVLDICHKINVKPDTMRGISIQVSKLVNSKDNVEQKQGGIINFLCSNLKKDDVNDVQKHLTNKIETHKSLVIPDEPLEKHIPSKLPQTETNKTNMRQTFDDSERKIFKESKKTTSPVKKIKSLGLTGRRRGRPPKNLSSPVKKKSISEKNQINKFLTTNHNNRPAMDAQYNLEDVDEDFLNALPDDIRKEILENCNTRTTRNSKQKHHNWSSDHKSDSIHIPQVVDPEYLAALPYDVRMEVESSLGLHKKVIPPISNPKCETDKKMADDTSSKDTPSDILNLNWKDMREMLRDWLRSNSIPMNCDVELITSYMRNLVVQKKIENLHCLVNFLYRSTVDQTKCEWHAVYLEILGNIQEAMIMVYGNKLKAKNEFHCCNSII